MKRLPAASKFAFLIRADRIYDYFDDDHVSMMMVVMMMMMMMMMMMI